MAKGIVIIGTDTGVGKTVVSAGFLFLLRNKGLKATYFKPVLSGAHLKEGLLVPGDVHFVKAIAGLRENDANLNPFLYKAPVSPHLAAALEKRPIEVRVIKEKLAYLADKYDYVVVEGAGGLAVPLNKDGYMLFDLLKELKLELLVVTSPYLGTINHTYLTVKYAQGLGLVVKGIVVNGCSNNNLVEEDNLETIKKLTGVPIIGRIPKLSVNVEGIEAGNLKEEILKHLEVEELLGTMSDIEFPM